MNLELPFLALKSVLFIHIDHTIDNEYNYSQRNNKTTSKLKKCIDFQSQKLPTQNRKHFFLTK
jgi:hypothetical protein